MAVQEGGGLPGRPKSKGAVPTFGLGEQKSFNIIRYFLIVRRFDKNNLGSHVHWFPNRGILRQQERRFPEMVLILKGVLTRSKWIQRI